MKNASGFTLIEMMIAIMVVGILSAIAVPAYQTYIVRGGIDNCLNVITPARMVVDNVIQINGGSAASIDGNPNVIGLTADNSCNNITVTGDDDGNVAITGVTGANTMTWRRSGVDGTWSCRSTDQGLAPQTCP